LPQIAQIFIFLNFVLFFCVPLQCFSVLARELCKCLKENVLSFYRNTEFWTNSILGKIKVKMFHVYSKNRRGRVYLPA